MQLQNSCRFYCNRISLFKDKTQYFKIQQAIIKSYLNVQICKFHIKMVKKKSFI